MNHHDMVSNEKALKDLKIQPTELPYIPDNCVLLKRFKYVMLCYGLFGTRIIDWRT